MTSKAEYQRRAEANPCHTTKKNPCQRVDMVWEHREAKKFGRAFRMTLAHDWCSQLGAGLQPLVYGMPHVASSLRYSRGTSSDSGLAVDLKLLPVPALNRSVCSASQVEKSGSTCCHITHQSRSTHSCTFVGFCHTSCSAPGVCLPPVAMLLLVQASVRPQIDGLGNHMASEAVQPLSRSCQMPSQCVSNCQFAVLLASLQTRRQAKPFVLTRQHCNRHSRCQHLSSCPASAAGQGSMVSQPESPDR